MVDGKQIAHMFQIEVGPTRKVTTSALANLQVAVDTAIAAALDDQRGKVWDEAIVITRDYFMLDGDGFRRKYGNSGVVETLKSAAKKKSSKAKS